MAAFLDERIPFTAIHESILEVMDAHRPQPVRQLGDVLAADAWARAQARDVLQPS